MTGSKANALLQLPIAISAPELWRLDFERRELADGQPSASTDTPLTTQLSVARLALDEIGVELMVGIRDVPPFSIEVAYRARFHVQGTELTSNLEETLKAVAARIAPATLYPFIRETIATTLSKAGIQAPLLPVLNFGVMFSPAEIELPTPPNTAT